MLDITIPEQEYFDEEKQVFLYTKPIELHMEHSLMSIAKWESKWHKAFLTKRDRSPEETIDYFRCMIVNKVDPSVVDFLTSKDIKKIIDYINEPMTAVYMGDENSSIEKGSRLRDTTTAELLYFYMITLSIPFECEKWHINRLLALIHVCEVKNRPSKTMTASQINRRNKALNEARKKKTHSRG